MCGIAGYIGITPPNDGAVRECLNRMHRRGPDASGVFRHRHSDRWQVCLLHSRLSIIDLDERANQPFESDGTALVFNGELYNYLELRRDLDLPMLTESDTETLARALAHWGKEALDRCEGMWAFGFYESRSGRLILSRDRFGEKPLYYLQLRDGLYFGSEVKFIAALCGRSLDPNLAQIRRFLVNGYRSLYKSGETFHSNLKEVAAGTIMTLSPDQPRRTQRYWSPTVSVDERLGWDDAVALAGDKLMRAVELRLRADVPVAFCMSGGIDSNSLISIARRVLGVDVHGFTIVNSDMRYSEQDMVDVSVRELEIRHTAVQLTTAGFLDHLAELVAYHDAPVFTISSYLQWMLMSAVHEAGYKVVISGTGADELFSGYYDHHLAYLADMRRDSPEFYRQALSAWRTYVLPHVQNPLLRDPDLFVADPDERRHLYMNADRFAGYLCEDFEEPFREDQYPGGMLRSRMLNELFVETIPPPLHEEDLNAMYYSVENRSPFLDRELFEACYTIPTRHLIRDGMAKAVLRAAVATLVPDQIRLNRRKIGFNAPILDLFDTQAPATRARLLDGGPVFDLVDRNAVEALMSRSDLDNSHSLFLFYVLSANMFLEHAAVAGHV